MPLTLGGTALEFCTELSDYDLVIEPLSPHFRRQGEGPIAFSVAEFETIRAEVVQALAGQQSILGWSVGAIGVLFAAALALAHTDTVAHAGAIRLGVFGLAVPLLAGGASFAWLGELFRVERDARYLRILERTTWPDAQPPPEPPHEDAWVQKRPIAYNSWVAAPGAGHRVVIGYFGGLVIFLGSITASLVLFGLLWFDEFSGGSSYVGPLCALAGETLYAYMLIANMARLMLLSDNTTSETFRELVLPVRIRIRVARSQARNDSSD